MKIVFNNLYIFSSNEGLAKHLEFVDGINIISSSQKDGTDRGKSVLMRSIYHTLGADCQFDDKWHDADKTYILNFNIDDKEYYMYRSDQLFKFFDNTKKLLFKTISRRELAENLNNYFKFAVQLPNRHEDKLEITPPAYNYLLYFLDQDFYNGTEFASFGKLKQYSNYKENVLYYHFGVFDKSYFETIKELERLKIEKSVIEKKQMLTEGMFEKTNNELNELAYSSNIDVLKIDINIEKEKYAQIMFQLNKARNKLIELKNNKYELENVLSELRIVEKKNDKEIEKLKNNLCPYCSSTIDDSMNLRSKKYNANDDIFLLSNDVEVSMMKISEKINKETVKYKELLLSLEAYETKLRNNSENINDVLRHKGFIEIRDSLLKEIFENKQKIQKNADSTKELNKIKSKYDDLKKNINSKYYQYLISDKIKFGVSEIDNKKFENIKLHFSASGSNKPIATVMWYLNIIKLKNEYNPDAIKFPIVFDSPNNAETDDIKRHVMIEYLLENSTDQNQLIISTIGFDNESFGDEYEINVLNLTNEKYKILNKEDYEENCHFLNEFSVLT